VACSRRKERIDTAGLDQTTSRENIVPEIVGPHQAAEIIQTDGEAEVRAVKGTNLLYVKNSEGRHHQWISTPAVLSYWWRALVHDQSNLRRPVGVRARRSAAQGTFPNIPAGIGSRDVRTMCREQLKAKRAVLENSIPQTAAVDRKTAQLDVKLRRPAQVRKHTRHKMSYAVNTDKSVLLISGRYYCCDQAIWFESTGPSGPWTVSTKVPDDVQSIPPDCPVYNVKYVYIYEATPEVCTKATRPRIPARTSTTAASCTAPATTTRRGTARITTRGQSRTVSRCTTNPWTGWGFSVGISYGWMSVSFGHYGGYWGPGGYGYGYRHGIRTRL
jgi:hypothetical protein